jgi:hypothetical protein
MHTATKSPANSPARAKPEPAPNTLAANFLKTPLRDIQKTLLLRVLSCRS